MSLPEITFELTNSHPIPEEVRFGLELHLKRYMVAHWGMFLGFTSFSSVGSIPHGQVAELQSLALEDLIRRVELIGKGVENFNAYMATKKGPSS